MSVLKKFRKAAQNDGEGTGIMSTPPKKKSSLRNERRSWEREGAWRIDNHGDYWWFEGEHLDELDELNKTIDDDGEFWQAFADLIKAKGITKTRTSSSKYASGGSSKGWGSGWSWKDDLYGESGTLSSYWNPWSKKGAKWSSDLDTRVALAMRAVQTTVQIIDDSGVKMSVVPSQDFENTVAFTDFERGRIVISAKPIGDSSLKEGEAIDVMTGYGLHEASHSKYTRPVWDTVAKSDIKPLAVAGTVANLAEDMRIERLTSEEFPGFAPYFDKANGYIWPEVKTPEEYGPDLSSKLNAAISIVKWPEESKPKTTKYPEEVEWWTDWIAKFKGDGSNLRERVEAAMAHLRAATEEEKQKGEGHPDEKAEGGEGGKASSEMDEQAEMEEKMRQEFEQAVKEFQQRMKITDFCAHDPSEHLDGVDAENVQKLVDEELTREDIEVVTPNGSVSAPVYVSKPLEDNASRRAYDPKSDPMLNLYKSALVFRRVDPHWSIKLQREGEIDDDELWRWAADDWRVFEEKRIPHEPKVRIGLLVDISGSMHGRKLDAAIKLARLFVDALTSIHGVTPYVWAHTGDIGEEGSQVYRIWEPGDPMTRLGLLDSLDHGNNYDGHAIAYVANQIQQAALPNEQKLLIVLSDGLPSGGMGYGGYEGQRHVRIAVEDAQKSKDIRVLQIAIDTSVDEERQRRMFDEFIPFKPGDSLDSVPKRLTRWLERAL